MDDFLIIGGGIAGISAAARLSELGRVVVLEAEDALAYHASGRSAAMYEESYGLPSTIALNRASAPFFQGESGTLSPRGLMIVAGPGEEAAFGDDLATMHMNEIGVDEALAMIPVLDPAALSRAGFHADAWDIDTDALIQGFARTARGNGGQVVTGARVQTVARIANGWRVSCTDGATHAARVLVNAAGAWADEVAEMAGITRIGIQPYRRSMARVAAPAGLDVSDWPMLFGPGETWYAKPDAGALLISPADEDPVDPHDAWADDMMLAEGIARYEARVTAPVTRMIANWAGLRSFAPDRNLVIGPAAGQRAGEADFLWMAGQGGYGFQTAPAASRLLADLAAGRQSELDRETVAALSPARFG